MTNDVFFEQLTTLLNQNNESLESLNFICSVLHEFIIQEPQQEINDAKTTAFSNAEFVEALDSANESQSAFTEGLSAFQSQLLELCSELEKVSKLTDSIRALKNQHNALMEQLSQSARNTFTHFSTYSCNNVGDHLLTYSLQKSFENAFTDPVHWINMHVDKEFSDDIVAAINHTNGILVGGGGLIFSGQEHSKYSGWQWPCTTEYLAQIQVPIILAGIGFNQFRGQDDFAPHFQKNINAVVRKADFVGLRNHGSIRALKNYLDEDLHYKLQYHPCASTVLSHLYDLPKKDPNEQPFIAINFALDRSELRFGERSTEFLSDLLQLAYVLSVSYKLKCYCHLPDDGLVLKAFEENSIPCERVNLYEMTQEEILHAYSTPALVVGMRGHSQMTAFGCNTPCLSVITHDKIAWFLEDIQHPEWGVDFEEDHFREKLYHTASYLLSNEAQVRQEIEDAQNVLWEITLDNLHRFDLILHASEL